MVAVSSDYFLYWIKNNVGALLFAVVFVGIIISLIFIDVTSPEISRGDVLCIIAASFSAFVSFYFGIELLATQQELREYKDALDFKK
jgi:hypothetical protein